MKRKEILIWLIPIVSYIVNIIIVAVYGGTTENNIIAWVCCIVLGVVIILDQYSKENMIKFYNNIVKEERELIRSLSKALEEKEAEIEKLKEVKDGK